MQVLITAICMIVIHQVSSEKKRLSSIFTDQQLIFTSSFNITKILVPPDGTYIQPNDLPSILFTVSDPKLDGGSCIYVLQGLAAYEILEGGRDSTSGYGNDTAVYFGAKDGVYKFDPDGLSAKRYGAFVDNIIQIQKGSHTDAIYILTHDNKIYKLEKRGTIKTRIEAVTCATEFVLDTSNNIYYIACSDSMIHIIRSDGYVHSLTASVLEDFKHIKLIRPAFVMEQSIAFFGDGNIYVLYSNGTSDKKDLYINEMPSAISIDATLYIAVAVNGRIYEFNVMDVLLKSMFSFVTNWPQHLSTVLLSLMESSRDVFEMRVLEATTIGERPNGLLFGSERKIL